MRRKEREIHDAADMIAIIDKCKVCRLALSQGDAPYIVPLNYGYTFEGGKLVLYFHSAKEGRKMDIIRSNARACFEVDCDGALIAGDTPCAYSFAYKSVIGEGIIVISGSAEEKIKGLTAIMKHQTGKDAVYTFEERHLSRVLVYKMIVDTFTGKALAAKAE